MSAIVKRQREVSDVVWLWKRICRGDSSRTFREFFGIPGIGKTMLSIQIRDALRSKGALCARLDFDPIQNPWGIEPTNEEVKRYYEEPEKLYKDLLIQWDYLDSPVLKRGLSLENDENAFDPRQFAHQVVELVKALSPERTVVLICDETDHIQWEQFSWFETDLIVPLVKSVRCLIVWLGRRKKQWSVEATTASSSIKTKIAESSDLKSFLPNDIGQQAREEIEQLKLTEAQKQYFIEWLYDVTRGHPMAVEAALRHYSHVAAEIDDLEEHKKVMHDIAERVIKGYILRDNPLQFDEALNISLLRVRDVSLLRVLAERPLDNTLSYGRLSNELMRNPLGDLANNRLLKQSVASLLQHYFRVSDPNGFLKKEDALFQECIKLSKRARKDEWSMFVVESVFHAACANMVTKKYKLSEILRDHLRSLQSSEIFDYSESLIANLEESFDKDKELEEYIGRDGIDQLLAILDDEKKRLFHQRQVEES